MCQGFFLYRHIATYSSLMGDFEFGEDEDDFDAFDNDDGVGRINNKKSSSNKFGRAIDFSEPRNKKKITSRRNKISKRKAATSSFRQSKRPKPSPAEDDDANSIDADQPPSFSKIPPSILQNPSLGIKQFPLLKKVSPFVIEIHAGEMLYLPASKFLRESYARCLLCVVAKDTSQTQQYGLMSIPNRLDA